LFKELIPRTFFYNLTLGKSEIQLLAIVVLERGNEEDNFWKMLLQLSQQGF
jgi:hypothetical protein